MILWVCPFVFCRLWNCTDSQVRAFYAAYGITIDDLVLRDVAELQLSSGDLEHLVHLVNTENYQWNRIMRVTGLTQPSE